MLDFWKYNKTDHIGGGLRPPKRVATEKNSYLATPEFVAPKRIDNRDLCIATSNQFQTPHCAGYATAGFLEVQNWKRLHYPEQLNGDAIYAEAKKIDGDTSDGTSLDSAAQAAINLGLVSGKLKYIGSDPSSIQFAIHTHTVCVAGFMITDEWNRVQKDTGMISDFGPSAKTLGGHAVLICGYDINGVYIQNSWGTDWGLYGFAQIPWPQTISQFMYGMLII